MEIRIDRQELERFCAGVFAALGMPDGDAGVAARVLVAADASGIPSHGVGRMGRYVEGLSTGLMLPKAESVLVNEGPTTLVVDARGAMGAPVSVRTMDRVIEKAKEYGSAFACVRDSNHFGIAGFYARMALEADMIGIAMTNTAALGVPTFGTKAMFGTNPFAFAAPAGREKSFVLDMSTTVVTRGKIEVHQRSAKPLQPGWTVDQSGKATSDAAQVLEGLQNRSGGGILPLGGLGTAYGGHKGYGLAVMVDILCALLCGAPFGQNVYDTPTSSARVSHFFGAIKIASFRNPEDFRRDMDAMLGELRTSPPAEDQDRVLYAGLPEQEREAEYAVKGIPLPKAVYDALVRIGAKHGLELKAKQRYL
jgi:LDH2 family malate/lactate/ureidoglycolate dehydrogenase